MLALVAQTTSGESASFDIFSLLLPLALAFLIFTMFRRQRKSQQQVKQMRTQMEPGTEVMTQFGLFGTILSIDSENNKAVIELSPGNTATVHTQALAKVVEQKPAAVQDGAVQDGTVQDRTVQDDLAQDGIVKDGGDLTAYDGSSIPDDASSIDGVDGPSTTGSASGSTTGSTAGSTAAGSSAAGTVAGSSGIETPQERAERLDREESGQENRGARESRDPKGNADS